MGSGTRERQRVDAMRAARMRRAGMTLGEIARAMSWEKAVVPNRIQLGERLLSLYQK